MKINPFNPNSPVNPGMFVGRMDELESMERALVQTRNDSPCHFMITGERGIGKSSLLLYIRYLATGDIPFNGDKFKFLVIDLDIDINTTQIGLISRIQTSLERSLGNSERAKKFFVDAWDFIQRIKVMDCGLDAKRKEEQSEEVKIDQFATSLSDICNRVCKDEKESNIFDAKYDGVLLLIDEADNCSRELNLGSLLKLLLERLQRRGCNKVIIGLAGLPDLRSKLYLSHQSSVRMFQELQLGRLTEEEVRQVIGRCIDKANEDNSEKTSIEEDAVKLLVSLSEGFPHFIQQFGYSSFNHDKDGVIKVDDVQLSAFGKGGALEAIGDRYYRHDFYNKIQQESYRQVLRIMADFLDDWVPLKTIKSKFKGKSSTLTNAIKALKDRHIIISKEGEKGVYRLQHKGFAMWIRIYADPDFWKKLIDGAKEMFKKTEEEK